MQKLQIFAFFFSYMFLFDLLLSIRLTSKLFCCTFLYGWMKQAASKSSAVLICIDSYWWVVLWKRICLLCPSNPRLKGWRTGHKRQTCLGDLLSSRAKAELMSVPDYNDPLRHTNLPSPRLATASISRVRGDIRHMIDVCLWRNQEGAQINFSLSSFDFVWLIYFLTSSQDAAWRMVNEKRVVCSRKLLRYSEVPFARLRPTFKRH